MWIIMSLHIHTPENMREMDTVKKLDVLNALHLASKTKLFKFLYVPKLTISR